MILLRRWKTASYKHQIVSSSHTETLGIFLKVNLILVILGLTYLPLAQKLFRKETSKRKSSF